MSGIEWAIFTGSTTNGPASISSPGRDLLQRHVLELVLVELGADHRDGQRAAVDGRPVVELAQHERQRAHVVLVTVGEHDRLDVGLALAQVGEVRAAPGRCPSWSGAGKRRPVSTTTIRPSYSTTVMFLPISPSPPRGRTRSFLLMASDRFRAVRGARARSAAPRRSRLGLDQRQPRAARRRGPSSLSAAFTDAASGATHSASYSGLSDVLDLRAALGLVDHAPHLGADQVGGHQDAARSRPCRAPRRARRRCRASRSRPVDRRQVLVARLLDRGHDVVDLGQLGEQVVGQVDHRCVTGCCRAPRGRSVAAATARKWAIRPARLGLL